MRHVAAIHKGTAIQFLALPCGNLVEHGRGDAEGLHGVCVSDLCAPFPNGTQRELFVARRTQLADDQHIQRGAQGVGNGSGDRHTASGQCEDGDI